MRPIPKVFFYSLVIFLFSFVPLDSSAWADSLQVLAGQPDSEFDLKNKTISGLNLIANPIIDDFLVNDDTGTANQYDPSIAIDGLDNFIVTWADYRNGNWDIYAQRYNSSSAPIGSNFKVNDDAGSASQRYPAIALDGSGNFVITWMDYRNGDADIYAQRYNSAGTPIVLNFKVNDDAGTTYQNNPAIAMDGSGNFVITWMDDRNGYLDIYAQRYHYSGTPLNSNFKVNDDAGTAWQWFPPAIAMNVYGNFVITWADYRNGNYDIYAQRYNSSGTRLGSNFQINEAGTAWQLFPAIALDGTGNFVITWQDERNGNYDIYVQRYNSSGTPLGSNFKVNDDTGTTNQYYPDIAMDGSGSFVITWYDYRNGNPDIYAQRYNSTGVALGSNYLVPNSQYASFNQKSPAVCANSSNIYFTWQDDRRGNWDIYAKVVDWTWTEVGEEQEVGLPNSFELSQNFPNPFNPATTISFTVYGSQFIVHSPIHTTLTIYNLLGQKVRTLVDKERLPGNYKVIWDGRDNSGEEVASGIYFYQLKTKDYTETKKMVLLR